MKNWISKTLSEGRKRPCERFFFGLDKYSTAPEERATEAHSGILALNIHTALA